MSQVSAMGCNHPYTLLVITLPFTVLASATLWCSSEREEVLVSTVGGITGMMEHRDSAEL